MPSGGLPPIMDFHTVFKSVIFTGLQLDREPLDLAKKRGSNTLNIVKGWTRASVVMLIVLGVSEAITDIDDPSAWDQLVPLQDVLDHAWLLPAVVRRCTKDVECPVHKIGVTSVCATAQLG